MWRWHLPSAPGCPTRRRSGPAGRRRRRATPRTRPCVLGRTDGHVRAWWQLQPQCRTCRRQVHITHQPPLARCQRPRPSTHHRSTHETRKMAVSADTTMPASSSGPLARVGVAGTGWGCDGWCRTMPDPLGGAGRRARIPATPGSGAGKQSEREGSAQRSAAQRTAGRRCMPPASWRSGSFSRQRRAWSRRPWPPPAAAAPAQ